MNSARFLNLKSETSLDRYDLNLAFEYHILYYYLALLPVLDLYIFSVRKYKPPTKQETADLNIGLSLNRNIFKAVTRTADINVKRPTVAATRATINVTWQTSSETKI